MANGGGFRRRADCFFIGPPGEIGSGPCCRVVLLGCVWWRHGRVRKQDLLFLAPFVLLSLVLGVTTIWFQYHRVLQGGTMRADGVLSRAGHGRCVPLVLLVQGVAAIRPERRLPKMEHRSVPLDFLPAGTRLAGLLRAVLAATQDMGTGPVIRAGIFCGHALSGAGIFRPGLLSVLVRRRSLAVLFDPRSHCLAGGCRGEHWPAPEQGSTTSLGNGGQYRRPRPRGRAGVGNLDAGGHLCFRRILLGRHD